MLRCDRRGDLVELQEVELVEVGGRELPVVGAWLRPDATTPARRERPPSLEGAVMSYPDAARTALADWRRAAAGALPPTPGAQPLAAPARAGLRAGGARRCTSRQFATLWRLERNAGYRVHVPSLPHRRRTLRRIVQAHKVWNRGRNRCGMQRRRVIRMPYRGRSPVPVRRGDGRDQVDFGRLAAVGCRPPALACAIAGQVKVEAGTLVPDEVDIRFSPAYRWWSGKRRPPSRRQDVRSTATHEVGHKLGLGHVPQASRQAMCTPCGIPGTSYRRTLGRGDVLGLWALYGGGALIADGRY